MCQAARLEALIETAELLQVPEILTDISQAREEYQQGETKIMEDIFDRQKCHDHQEEHYHIICQRLY